MSERRVCEDCGTQLVTSNPGETATRLQFPDPDGTPVTMSLDCPNPDCPKKDPDMAQASQHQ